MVLSARSNERRWKKSSWTHVPLDLKMEGEMLYRPKRRKSPAAGPGTAQIYLLTDGECGEHVWREKEGSEDNNEMKNRKWQKGTELMDKLGK